MGLVPIHAAGRQWGRGIENTASHIVSSYILTFKALAYAREKCLKPLTQAEQELLVVGMPDTKGMSPLEVMDEVEAIQQNINKSTISQLKILANPSKGEVLDNLRTCTVAHFACHGISDLEDPSDSCLFIGEGFDGKAGRLTIREMATVSLKRSQIAFLSTCYTTEISAQELVDEAIHVASSFHLIGFPHVIGTMWAARDDAAIRVTSVFYKELIKSMAESGENGSHDAVAYALHSSIQALWKVEDTGEYLTDDVISWAPFIHIGA
ncbi:hypothetical protein AOQ84DRAFT_396395 [Glonium stellatum]|uniref:CHAT domain-containing protein n=1 Tax=Glonium stellatum TaxID=574774 RepID=A0A8E2JVK4_9PEZI|nr:hypothetical protein AOQ84DRAFT_396395 [Glonium stellatum]